MDDASPRSHLLYLSSAAAGSASTVLVLCWATSAPSFGLLIILATATGVSWVATGIIWVVRRLEAVLPCAIELGRQLERERVRQGQVPQNTAEVIRLPRPHYLPTQYDR